mgnify:CR=1 FL=1
MRFELVVDVEAAGIDETTPIPPIPIDELHRIVDRALDEENAWWQREFRYGLTSHERRAAKAFLMRQILGDERFKSDLLDRRRSTRRA